MPTPPAPPPAAALRATPLADDRLAAGRPSAGRPAVAKSPVDRPLDASTPAPRRGLRRRLRAAAACGALALALGAPDTPARADEVADGLPRTAVRVGEGGVLRLYGHVNRGFLVYDDGGAHKLFPLIDNGNSQSRVGLHYLRAGETTFEGRAEIGYAPYASDRASFAADRPARDDFDLTKNNIRKLEVSAARPALGQLSLGQGSMATDGITEIDFSETSVVAYSSVGASAGGQLFREDGNGGALTDIRVGDAFASFDGSRRARLRYDTPTIAGAFTASVSYGHNLLSDEASVRKAELVDVALRFERRQGGYWLAAGGGWSRLGDGSQVAAGSGSVLHVASGLNLTLAAGAADDTSSRVLYGKLGLRRNLVSWGETAVSVDLYTARDPYLDASAGIASSASRSVGLAAVQKIDAARVEVWGTVRVFRYSDNSASYEDGRAVFAGARWRF
ncbi:hypothetical protein [uncultured Albimonas sp.]|uniref:hypothetical protein n=1 Tax=uncultured Albimonas sp. TaxID=1331701 RepID=UPI0030EC3C16